LLLGLFAMDEPALLAYARDSLGSDVQGYALILVAWGSGMLLGGLAYARMLARSMVAVFGWGAALSAVGYVGLGVAPSLAVALLVALVGGAGNGVYWVALVTAVQESTGDGEQAQHAARLEGIATAAPALGVVVGGVVAEYISPRASLLIPGLLALSVLALWALALRVLGGRMHPAGEPPRVIAGADVAV
jgi:predicted MFS family arabinose efflux permease